MAEGRISRRDFMARAVAIGVAAPVAAGLANLSGAAAQDATPVASPSPARRPSRPPPGRKHSPAVRAASSSCCSGRRRPPQHAHLAGSFKDQLAASLVTEPLIHFLPDGTLIPSLVKEVPSHRERTGLAADLLDRHLQPARRRALERRRALHRQLTSSSPGSGSSTRPTNRSIALHLRASSQHRRGRRSDRQDHLQRAALGWYIPFSSSQAGGILPEARALGRRPETHDRLPQQADRHRALRGRFLHSRTTRCIYSINENYREPNKPFFAKRQSQGRRRRPTAAAARAADR